jgi:transposase/arginine repressor
MLEGLVVTMAPHLSADAKAAIETSLRRNLERPDFNAITAAHKTTNWTVREIYRKMRERALFGSTITSDKIGRPRALTLMMEESVIYLVSKTPWVYQEEICEFLREAYHVEVHKSTISRLLARLKVTRKKLVVQARERDQELRAYWQWQLRNIKAPQLVCIDESGSNEKTGNRMYGYASVGATAVVQRWLRSKKKVSVCPAYSLEGVIDSITYYGSMNAEIFRDFILNNLLQVMNPFPMKHSVLILDNAEFHHTYRDEIEAACHAKGIIVLYLPPYSPDLNPIEEFFADLKKYIKKTYEKEYRKHATYQDYLEWAVKQCGRGDQAKKNARGHFRHAGYDGVPDN